MAGILVVCKRYYTHHDLIGERYGRLFHLPRHWARREQVQVICADYGGRYARERHEIDGVTFDSVPVRASPFSLLGFWSYLRERAALQAPRLIVASSDIAYGVLASRLAARTGAAWVFDVYDDYRHFRINRYLPTRLLFGGLCRSAGGIIAVSPRLREIASRFGERVAVVGNGYDASIFHPQDRSQARLQLGFPSHWKIVVHTGSVDSRFDAGTVLAAFDALHARDPDVRLVLAGANVAQVRFEHPWAVEQGVVDQRQVARLVAAADLCLAPYAPGALSDSCNPCKLAEYLACQRPVLAADVSDLASYAPWGVTTYRTGDPGHLCRAAAQLLERRPGARAAEHLSWDELGARSYAFLAETADRARSRMSP